MAAKDWVLWSQTWSAPPQRLPSGTQKVLLPGIVSVQEGNIVSGKAAGVLLQNMVDSRISGGRYAAVGLVDHMDPFFACGNFVAKLRGAPGGTVIHKNDVDLPAGLVQDRIYRLFQVFFYIIAGDNNMNRDHIICPPVISLKSWIQRAAISDTEYFWDRI